MASNPPAARGGAVRAPEFRSVDAWLNSDQPISLKELRGQVVLLDFWTYCCINCMHVLPDLAYLEDKYADEPFVVIGVHSGKFDQEKDPAHIREAILRHNIRHPVAVDSDYQIWQSYGVNAWPTLVLIDPEGYVVGQVSGEGHREVLDEAIGKLLTEHRAAGTLAAAPQRFRAEREAFTSSVLEYPGKVRVDAARRRLIISDTNHHRLLVADLDGQVQHVIGSGEPGLRDGSFAEARFHQPQGVAVSEDGQTLYVADTENHALRAIDIARQTVVTIAGTGTQGYNYRSAGPGREVDLSSPWALARAGHALYIAMAGTHQIWTYDLDTQRVAPYAGTGREAAIDGPADAAGFAQPSGLATDGQRLYVADSEVSSIRVLDLAGAGQTRTLAGSGELFEFGVRDGVGKLARFQHPLGVALSGDRLFVADTFNHLVREIDVRSGAVRTLLGTGKAELGTEEHIGLFEPGGLDVAGDTLYIADTNHHRILAVDLATKHAKVVDVRLPK